MYCMYFGGLIIITFFSVLSLSLYLFIYVFRCFRHVAGQLHCLTAHILVFRFTSTLHSCYLNSDRLHFHSDFIYNFNNISFSVVTTKLKCYQWFICLLMILTDFLFVWHFAILNKQCHLQTCAVNDSSNKWWLLLSM